MTSISCRMFLSVVIAVLLNVPVVRAQDDFRNGDGHNGAFVAPQGGSSINIYSYVTMNSAPGDSVVTVVNTRGFEAGDLVMLWRATGLYPAPAAGDQSTIDLSRSPIGRYELARVLTITEDTFTFTTPLRYDAFAGLTQIIRIPEFTTVNVPLGSSLQPAHAWDGTTGGIVAFLATGLVTVDGSINADGSGFTGGRSVLDLSGQGDCALEQVYPSPLAAFKGEGLANDTSVERAGFRNVANAGGGGLCYGGGGGGGGHAGAGGRGGLRRGPSETSPRWSALPGSAVAHSLADRLLFGGWGGAAHQPYPVRLVDGSPGGGVVFVRAAAMDGAGRVSANALWTFIDGGGGLGAGGAGGSVYVRLDGTTTICAGVQAKGAAGGGQDSGHASATVSGGGGGGQVLLQTISRCDNVDVAGGPPGVGGVDVLAVAYPGQPGLVELFNTNTPPSANAGPDQRRTGCQECLVPVTLSGQAADPDGEALNIEWIDTSAGHIVATGLTATVFFSVGTHNVEFRVSDSFTTTTDTVVIDIVVGSDDELRRQIEDANATIAARDRTIADQLMQISDLARERDGFADDARRLRADLERAIQTIADRDATIVARDQAIADQLSQIARLTVERNALTVDNASLRGELTALLGHLRALQQMLQLAFNNPGFVIPGATLDEQVKNLIAALDNLNPGQKLALYRNLGGAAGK